MKWYLHDDGYTVHMINGRHATQHFKNVCITDNADWNKSEMFIWHRVYKATEKEDMHVAELIRSAPEMYEQLRTKQLSLL